MMTPGDFASLQEGREGLSTEDYISWRLPYVLSESIPMSQANGGSEEEEPEEHFFPLTLRTKKVADRPSSPLDSISVNGK